MDRGYKIVERFLKFSNVSRDCTALGMDEVVKATLSKFGASVKSKLIIQTYDGAAVMSGQLSGLQKRIHQDYPFAFFFHCAAHRFNLVLCQSAQTIKQIKWVFSKVNSICTFSSSCPDRHLLLQNVLIYLVQVKLDGIISSKQSLPSLCSLKLTCSSVASSAIQSCYCCFNFIIIIHFF